MKLSVTWAEIRVKSRQKTAEFLDKLKPNVICVLISTQRQFLLFNEYRVHCLFVCLPNFAKCLLNADAMLNLHHRTSYIICIIIYTLLIFE